MIPKAYRLIVKHCGHVQVESMTSYSLLSVTPDCYESESVTPLICLYCQVKYGVIKASVMKLYTVLCKLSSSENSTHLPVVTHACDNWWMFGLCPCEMSSFSMLKLSFASHIYIETTYYTLIPL